MSIISETSFLDKTLSIKANLILWCLGRMFDKINLPAVLLYLSETLLPFSSTVSYRQIISECKLILFTSIACSISLTFVKYPFGFEFLVFFSKDWDK